MVVDDNLLAVSTSALTPIIPLGDAADFLSGGTPPKSEKKYWEGQIPWVSAKDMKTLFIADSEDHITKEGAIVGSKIAPVGSILILVRGMTLLSDIPISYADREVAFNQDVKALVPRKGVDSRFLLYALLAAKPKLLDHVDQAGHGTGRLASDLLRSLKIPLPHLEEQRCIAHILGTLDDKIELNRRMNATLEAMAQALFRSWFVDFDPVRVKAEGREPAGMDVETAALFPDEFEESELGEIPKGWEVVPLPEIVEINPRRSLAKGEVAPYLDMQNVPTSGHRPLGWIDRSFTSGTKFINGDTLIARITPCLEHGKTIFVDFLPEGQVGWGSTEFIVLRPKGGIPPEYGYLLGRDPEFREYAISNMSGSSGRQRVPSDCFDSYNLVVPPECIWRLFGELVHPNIQGISSRDYESRILTALRDTLLPRLISGEIRVTDEGSTIEALP